MTMLKISTFNARIPRLNPVQLPQSYAQKALNCDVSSGSLDLLTGVSDGSCGASAPSHSAIKVAVPNKPTLAVQQIFDPETDLTTVLYLTSTVTHSITYLKHTWTNYGFDISYSYAARELTGTGISGASKISMTVQGVTVPTAISANDQITNYSLDIEEDSYLYAILKPIEVIGLPILGYAFHFAGATSFMSAGTFTIKCSMNFEVPYNQYLYYRTTFEDTRGREGPPSDVSSQIVRKAGHKVTVSFAGTETAGDETPTKVHVYRAERGQDMDRFFHVDEVTDNGTGSFEDKVPQSGVLGRPLPVYKGTSPPTKLWGNRPDSLTKLIQMPSMFFVGYKDQTIYFSGTREKNHLFSSDFAIELDYDIVDIQNIDNTVIAVTEGGVYGVYGREQYEHWANLLSEKCCNNATQVVKLNNMVYYVSPDGLIRVSSTQAQVISSPYFDITDWRALTPSTMTLTARGDRLYMFTASSSEFNYVLDFKSNEVDIVETDFTDATFTATQMEWKSKKFLFNQPISFKRARVIADSYSGKTITLKIYADGVLSSTTLVTDNLDFSIVIINPAKYWEIEVISDVTIHELAIAQSSGEFIEVQ